MCKRDIIHLSFSKGYNPGILNLSSASGRKCASWVPEEVKLPYCFKMPPLIFAGVGLYRSRLKFRHYFVILGSLICRVNTILKSKAAASFGGVFKVNDHANSLSAWWSQHLKLQHFEKCLHKTWSV